jgi:hypothetical protein
MIIPGVLGALDDVNPSFAEPQEDAKTADESADRGKTYTGV